MVDDKKRLFFGTEVLVPWPHSYPKGRLLEETQRHITLAFLGNVSYQKISTIISSIPLPQFKIGLAGICDENLLLPPRHPRVVAWHVDWIDNNSQLSFYQKQLADWLRSHEFDIDKRDFLPHITVCRAPFDASEWKKLFTPLPCITKNLHLYESLGDLQYKPVWSFPIKSPFDEIDHTADIAYLIRGESLQQLFNHAQIALAFRFPSILLYLDKSVEVQSLEEIITKLNEIIFKADTDIGCPFKAISYHGGLNLDADRTFSWEMIVDV